MRTLVSDTFGDDQPQGAVLGTASTSGDRRTGVDVEGRLAVDNGALRIRPLEQPGWGREGVAYGPWRREPGLTFAVQVLNGHHASQTFMHPETSRQRVRRVVGALARGKRPWRDLHFENLAVGVFGSAAPTDPLAQGHAFVMHSATADNGELWSSHGGTPQRVLRGVQNLPLACVVVLRERGAALYAASAEEDPDFPALPLLRPWAIDPSAGPVEVYGGVHQRILGEVGYRVDSRVFRVDAAVVPELATWCGTATVADQMTGAGSLNGAAAERGGHWRVLGGDVGRDSRGAHAVSAAAVARLESDEQLGLVHLLIDAGRRPAEVRLQFRMATEGHWEVRVGRRGTRLVFTDSGGEQEVARDDAIRLRRRRVHSLQLCDDGNTLTVHLDGRLAFDRWIRDSRLGQSGGLGIGLRAGGTTAVRDVEGHPRTVPHPLGSGPAWPATCPGTEIVFDDHFDGNAGELDGRALTDSVSWQRTEGDGRAVVRPEGGAVVHASVEQPNPGRTLWTVPWPDPDAADLTVTTTMPGTGPGAHEAGRGGVVLWQDDENYMVANLWVDDSFDGTSISTFYRVRGHEDMYDAVWTLTGSQVHWGKTSTLRVVFDNQRFTAYLDGRPCLYRAIRDVYPDAPPLRIKRVGLVCNEEWGDDTGSVFNRFTARSHHSTVENG